MATALNQETTEERDIERAAPEAPESGKKKFMLPIIGVLVLLGLWWGVSKWLYGRSHQTTDDAQVDGHIVPVLAKVGGYVASVSVAENQDVPAGATLVQIDDAEYRVKVQSAEADLAAARAAAGNGSSTGQAEAQVATASSQQGVISAQISAAQANAEKARADLARMKDLADQQIVSRQQLDAAQAAYDAAQANLLAVQRQSAGAGANVQGAQAGVRLAEARLAAAQAARDNAALQLSYTHITSPVSGNVSRKQVEVGQLIQAGQPLLSVVADTGVWVTANFKETQLDKIRVGQKAEVDIDAYGGCQAHGVVESVSPATGAKFALLPPDNATGNFTKVVQRVPVRIHITDGCGTGRPLRPGMSVTASIETK